MFERGWPAKLQARTGPVTEPPAWASILIRGRSEGSSARVSVEIASPGLNVIEQNCWLHEV
jgi:hypothetical protein